MTYTLYHCFNSMKAEIGVKASGECFSNPGCPRPHPKEPSMAPTVSSTFSRRFRRVAAGLAASLALGSLSAHARAHALPGRSPQLAGGERRRDDQRPRRRPRAAVVLIHGFGDTGDMWSPMAAELAKGPHRRRARPCAAWACPRAQPAATTSGRSRATFRAVLDKLGIDRADIVGHDIGTMVAYATRRAIRTRQAAWS